MWEFCTIELVYSVILLISSLDIGFTISYPYASTESLIEDLGITNNECRLFAGIAYMTAISGPYICDFVFHYFRRKTTIIIFMSINTLLWFILPSLNKNHFWIGYIDRAFSGIVLGALTSLVPIYLIEISPKECTGFFGSLFQFAVFFGFVTCELIGNYLDWKMISYIGGGICLFFLFMIWFSPDSPVIVSQRFSTVSSVTLPSNTESSPSPTLSTSETQTNNQDSRPHNSIFYWPYIQKITYGIILFFFQNFTGISIFFNNVPDVFKLTGIIFPDSMAYAVIFIVVVFFCFLGCFFHHSFGRKIPWIISSAGMFVSLLIQAIFLKTKMPKWIPFFTHFLYFSFFGISLSSYPYFALAEIFPSSLRSFAVAVGCSTSWVFTLFNVLLHKPIEELLGQFVLLIIFMCLAFLSCIFGYFFVDKPDLKALDQNSYYGIDDEERTSIDA